MAVYRNKNDDTIIRGSEFKLNISMDVIDSSSNNRIRNFYPNVDSNGKYVLWCRGKYGISDFYNAVSNVMVYDVEKDEIF